MARGWLLGIVAAAAALWAWFAFSTYGVFWPDEIFQSLEPAHRLVFGYGFRAWEFQLGARSWIFPGLLAGVLGGGALFGVDGPVGLVALAKGFMLLCGLFGLGAGVRLADAVGGRAGALAAGVLGATFPLTLVLAGRAFSETVCGTAIVVAAYLLRAATSKDSPAQPTWRTWVAGALLAVATLLRPGCALVVLGAVGLIWLSKQPSRRAHLLTFAGGAGGSFLLGGALDWATWGAPFAALALNLRYNVIEGHAADYGTAPVWYYAERLGTSTGPALLALGLALVAVPRALRGWLGVVALFVGVHALLPHKELRFLVPVVPLLLALVGAGVGSAWGRWARVSRASGLRLVLPLTALSALAGLQIWQARRVTYADMGRLEDDAQAKERAGTSLDGFNRLLFRAHEAPDLCGLAVAGAHVIWMGGFSYLHRNVPFFDLDPPTPAGSPAANYLLAPRAWSRPRQATLVATAGEAALYRYEHSCGPAPEGHDLFELPPR